MKKITPVILALVAIVAGILLSRQHTSTSDIELSGFAFPTPETLTNIALIDQDSTELTAESFKGKWTFLYVGYTFCPDACPMTLTIMDQLYETLADNNELSDDVAMMLVSVDPDRDTPERLKSYVGHFNERFTGATGTAEHLSNFAKQVNAVYSLPKDRSDPNYLVDHSSTIILIDPNAAVHAIFTPPQQAAKLAEDFRILKQRFS
jgi:protein SCO1/2